MFIQRIEKQDLLEVITNFPVTAIIGPRQCGKSSLVKVLLEEYAESIYLDLERPSDLAKLDNAEWFLQSQKGKLICIDEIQRKPELFPLIRSLVDEWNKPACFLILSSASRDLLKQSSESLAGRICYKRLTPFLINELNDVVTLEQYYVQGAFPRSILASSAKMSMEWRKSFIQTFLERDLLFWSGFTPTTMRRLWQMLAHVNGQMLNNSTLASSLGVSSVTVKNYIDLLEGTFMIEIVQPYISNLGKRLVKSPKVYIADSGITSALLNLNDFNQLSGHPAFGSLWEQIVLTNLKGNFSDAEIYFYRTSHGAECDFVMKWNNMIFAIECKSSFSPTLTKGNHNAFADILAFKNFVVIPNANGWSMSNNIEVVSLVGLLENIKVAL